MTPTLPDAAASPSEVNSLDLHFEGQMGAAAVQRQQKVSERYGCLARASDLNVEWVSKLKK